MSTEAPPAPAPAPAQLESAPPTDTSTPAPPPAQVETPAAIPAPPPETVVTDNRATPAAETPPPPPAITADGKLGENWFLTLGDEFSPHAKDLGKHKDIRSLVTELNYFRKNGIEYPGETAPQQAIDRFRKVAGVPETPDGYGITAENVKLPEGMAFDSELAEAVTKAAHKTHAPPAAVAAIVEQFNTVLAKRVADAQIAESKAKQAAQDSLVAEWRGDFQTNASTVRHLTARLADQAGILAEDPSVAEMANNPAFARIMLQVARLTSEDRVATPHGFGDLKTPAQRIAEITSGKDPVWGERYRNGDVAAYEHVNSLREKART
jgi:hypothetical protein